MRNKEKRLLQINTVANIGSTGHIEEQIGECAKRRGWLSWVAYGRDAVDSTSQLIRIGNKIDIYRHVIYSQLFDNHGLMSKKSTAEFINVIENIKPDIVHIHNLHGYYINYPILFNYLKQNNIPTIITLHDFWLITGHCAYIHDCCDKWKTGCEKCTRLKSYPSAIIDRSDRNWKIKMDLFYKANNIIVIPVSYWLKSKIESSILKNIRCKVIQNGIDTSKFYPDSHHSQYISSRYFNILCVATKWTANNGFQDIINLSKLIDNHTRIIIVGVSKKQKKNLPENVIGVERTESIEQLRVLYSNADVFLNPNREVTFGLVTAEAMACGTPSIVFHDTAGEEIVDTNTGYVINDVAEVLPLIQKISHIDKIKTRNVCRSRIIENFNIDYQLDKYFDVYESILKQSLTNGFYI